MVSDHPIRAPERPEVRVAAENVDAPSVRRGIGGWWETLLLSVLGGLVLIVMVRPAFQSFFMGEDFFYLGQYYEAGQNYWRAVFSSTLGIFFRPVFIAINLLWQFVLPPDPFVHQIRNVAFSILNIALLDRVLLRLVASSRARWLGVLFFVVSKVHLTAIGYINVYDSIVSLSLILFAILFFLRYTDERRLIDYGLALTFTLLSIFTKDYGLVIVGVVSVLVVTRDATRIPWRTVWRRWIRPLAPLPLMILLYLAVRVAVVGSLPNQGLQSNAYRPELTPAVLGLKLLVFSSTLANLTFSEAYLAGMGGLGIWIASLVPAVHNVGRSIDGGLYAAFIALVLLTLVLRRRAFWVMIFPLAWIGAYFGPTVLTRNLQMYYMYEPIAAVAVLLAVCLDQAGRRLFVAWSVALVVIGLNGAVSNAYSTSAYAWQTVTNAAAKIKVPILEAHRGEPLESITLVTSLNEFWQYTLNADGHGLVIGMMLHRPQVNVRIVTYADMPLAVQTANGRNLVFDIDNGFVELDANRRPPPPILRSISPQRVQAGTGFNVQSDGRSTIVVAADSLTPGTFFVLDGQRIDSIATVNAGRVDGLILPDVLAHPGSHTVYLSNGVSESNRLTFDVTVGPPSVGSATSDGARTEDGTSKPEPAGPLRLKQVEPPTTRAGQPFGTQSNGQSTLSLIVENARAGAVVVVNGTPVMTWYNPTLLVAEIPPELYRQPGHYDVYVKQDGAESERIPFIVEP